MSGRCYQNMATVQISHAQVLQINYYKKDKLLMQENIWEQDKSKTHHFVQTHGHIMYKHDTKHHTKVMEPPFPLLHLHKNYNLFKTIYQAINKLNQ